VPHRIGSVLLPRRGSARALACGTLAAFLSALAMLPTLRSSGWSLTALPHVDSRTKLGAAARAIEPGFRTIHPGAYDGQFYWAIAVDPLATGELHSDLDKPSYRYGHPLYGWLGWFLSGDRARAAPAALAAIGLGSMFAAATIASLLGLAGGGTGWEGLFVALNPGLLGAAAGDLAEPLGAALMLGALAAYRRGRHAVLWVCLALLPLAKEPLLLVVSAFVAWEVVQRRPRAAAILSTAALPALAWWTYCRIRLGAWFTSGDTALATPLSGWRRALLGPASGVHESALRHDAAVAALALLLAMLVYTAVRAARLRGPADYVYLALAAVAVCLAPNATAAFSTALRNTAFLVVLVPFVAVSRTLVPDARPAAAARDSARSLRPI
jgi:hypothetical protein